MKPKLIILSLVLLALSATADTLSAKTKAELVESFAQRKNAIRQLKDEGKIGETTAGLLEAVDPAKLPAAAAPLLAAENADRNELYAIIAKEQKTDQTTVAREAAQRHFTKAKPGDWFKTDKGEWRKVK